MKNKTLVFGASLKSERYSNLAIQRLSMAGHNVVAFGIEKGVISGVSVNTELKNYKDVDTVTLYLNPSRQIDFYKYLIDLNPNRIIFNPGTENLEFFKLLDEHYIQYEAACTLVLLSTNQY